MNLELYQFFKRSCDTERVFSIIRASIYSYKNTARENSKENKDINYDKEAGNSVLEIHFIEAIELVDQTSNIIYDQ